MVVSLLEALLRRLPVDHIPDSFEVLGLAILVLEAENHEQIINASVESRLTSMHAPKHQCRG
jgi:hypothetical protein